MSFRWSETGLQTSSAAKPPFDVLEPFHMVVSEALKDSFHFFPSSCFCCLMQCSEALCKEKVSIERFKHWIEFGVAKGTAAWAEQSRLHFRARLWLLQSLFCQCLLQKWPLPAVCKAAVWHAWELLDPGRTFWDDIFVGFFFFIYCFLCLYKLLRLAHSNADVWMHIQGRSKAM